MLVFFNDILVHSKNIEELVHHLKTVLQILKEHTLYAKMLIELNYCIFYISRTIIYHLFHYIIIGFR